MIEQSPKHTTHKDTGLPIRLSARLRNELRKGTEGGQIQLEMIQRSSLIGQRASDDCLPANLAENIRLRKVAWSVSKKLTDYAKDWKIDRFCTVVHGSLARGLVRNPNNPDPSDVDVDLVIDSNISKDTRKQIREEMFKFSSRQETKVDSYIWTLGEMTKNKGEYARLYLGSSAYSLVDRGNIWEEIVWIGVENQRYLSLDGHLKKQVSRLISLISQGNIEDVAKQIRSEKVREILNSYTLCEINKQEDIKFKAGRLYDLIIS